MHFDPDHFLVALVADVCLSTALCIVRHLPRTLAAAEKHGGRPAFDVLRDVAQSINPWIWLRYVSFGLLAYVVLVPAIIVAQLTADRTILLMSFSMPQPAPPGEVLLALPCLMGVAFWPILSIYLTRSEELREMLAWSNARSVAWESAHR